MNEANQQVCGVIGAGRSRTEYEVKAAYEARDRAIHDKATAYEARDRAIHESAAAHGTLPQVQASTVRVTVDVQAKSSFPTALGAALHGSRITRSGWNAGGQWVAAQHPDRHSKMQTPYLYLSNALGQLVPWVPSQGDFFAHDWAVLPS